MNQINLEEVRYFSEIFNGEANLGEDPHLILEVIPSCVKEDHNKILMVPMSMKEVRKAIFGLGSDKSPGPDGFLALFYQSF